MEEEIFSWGRDVEEGEKRASNRSNRGEKGTPTARPSRGLTPAWPARRPKRPACARPRGGGKAGKVPEAPGLGPASRRSMPATQPNSPASAQPGPGQAGLPEQHHLLMK